MTNKKNISTEEITKRIDTVNNAVKNLTQIAYDKKTVKHLEYISKTIKQSWLTNDFKILRGPSLLLKFKFKNKIMKIKIPRSYYFDLPAVAQGILVENEHQSFGFDQIQGNSWIIDGGANIGLYSLAIAIKNPRCKILAVEADPVTFKILKENILLNKLKKRIVPVNVFIDENEGKCMFQHYSLKSTVSSTNVKNIFGDRSWFNPSLIKTYSIHKKSIKSICNNIKSNFNIVKFDMDGGELGAIRSLIESEIAPNRIVVEYHQYPNRNTIIKDLKKHKFSLVGEVIERPKQIGNLYFELNH